MGVPEANALNNVTKELARLTRAMDKIAASLDTMNKLEIQKRDRTMVMNEIAYLREIYGPNSPQVRTRLQELRGDKTE